MEFETLPGFRAFYPGECARRQRVFEAWRDAARRFGFEEYDAPVLEPLELYVEKSGEEIVDQLFRFEDRGGRGVALRPEMTPSLGRLVAARANSLKRPMKWFNIGEQFRYERPQKGRLRAFHQFNADILGEPGPGADAELIALLVEILRAFGLGADDFRVRLSDRDLWLLFLASEGLEGDDAQAALGAIDKMDRVPREKTVEALRRVAPGSSEDLLRRIEELTGIQDLATLDERFRGLFPDGPKREAARERLEAWRTLLDRLEAARAGDCVTIDLGIVRGLAYYTGFVFEAFERSGASRALAGGGRYDGLVRKLGGPDMPAAGFAIGDVTLTDFLHAKGLMPGADEGPDFYLAIGGEDERQVALGDAWTLRRKGRRVDYSLKNQSLGKQFREADRKGARFVLVYGPDELARDVVKVKNLRTGEETESDRGDIASVAAEALRSAGLSG